MKLTELLEEDKETLLRALRGAGSPARATEAIERELERMLFAFNDAAPSARARESAAAMVGTLRAALPLMTCGGEVKVWEHKTSEKGVRLGALALVLLLLGAGCCLAAAALMLYHDMPPLLCVLPLAGGALLIFTGLRLAKDRGGVTEQKTEVLTDWDKVYRTLHTAALVMDQALEEAEAAERWEARRRDAVAPALTEAEAELMAGLLEAAYSGDGEFALEKLDAVRHYLRGKGIEVVDYSADTARHFDCMPGAKTATLCPALLQGGEALRRGTATVPG